MYILGIRIDKVNMKEAVEKAKACLNENELHMIFTPNPEMIINANEDEEFKTILNSSFINIPDGNGVVWASKQINEPLEERVAGFDFIHKLFESGKDSNISFYFLGAKPGIAKKAKENLERKYKNIKILGTHDGYFGANDEEKIISDINNSKADILLVALGAPKQEKFIYKYKDKLNCKIAIGVGGCFDVISGNVKRAPKLFIKLKLEWLYRGLSDIKRIKRLMAIPKFMWLVKREKNEEKDN